MTGYNYCYLNTPIFFTVFKNKLIIYSKYIFSKDDKVSKLFPIYYKDLLNNSSILITKKNITINDSK